jgi:hypothetical protein
MFILSLGSGFSREGNFEAQWEDLPKHPKEREDLYSLRLGNAG